MQFATRAQFVDQVIAGLDAPEKIRHFLSTLYACGYRDAGESTEDFVEWFKIASKPEIDEVLVMLRPTMGYWRYHDQTDVFSTGEQ